MTVTVVNAAGAATEDDAELFLTTTQQSGPSKPLSHTHVRSRESQVPWPQQPEGHTLEGGQEDPSQR
eukprot:CAMPEP_0184373670 /NCGR_PEP_ID=MMETSP1089-20130417/164619_1 /TAXON_ID=38269 ORGANISM="Gloeochaete wittrockiana, Strain SAG46.84" /NCGR_SAMPLE_ID=MMETSP1089 /ASSEMBLY_ACC=CAM_ASM_000445 /LENGTH=66 /DNA_ID=CAMNT_0026716641 /DNA_START=106 /DNA_END=306 /DNA_ORIENTATION=+